MKIGSYYFVGENVSHSTLLWKRKKAQVYVNLCCSVTLMLPLLTVQFYVCCCLQMQLVIVCPQQWHYRALQWPDECMECRRLDEHMECRRTRFGCLLPFSLVVCRLLDILCDSVQTHRFSQCMVVEILPKSTWQNQ